LVREAGRLRKLWRARFSEKDPMPAFIEMLDELIANLL